MSENPSTLQAFLASAENGQLQTDDVLFMLLPLFRAVAQLHMHGRVAELGGFDVLCADNRSLVLRRPEGRLPRSNADAIRKVQPLPGSTLNIVGESSVTLDLAQGLSVEQIELKVTDEITRPTWLPGLQSWELALEHHDELTDIFQLGQILACVALGLDFCSDSNDLESFVTHRRNLFRLNTRLNPVVAGIVVEMTALNRHDRASDLGSLVRRLETYRDQPVGLDVERVLSERKDGASRREAVLSHLRDRLFDLSRRNRLLYFRPTQSTVNLTVASVPLVLQISSIRPEQICTWDSAFAREVVDGGAVNLQRWLRFEDQPYLPASLDRLIQETRRDRAEYGFSHLRLVVAFLRWHNLKESPDERIVSPLLWLPVQLVKKKGVRDQYMLQCEDAEAELNPALRHQLRQLYDIALPESVNLREVSIEQIHIDIAAQIHRSEPSVELRLLKKPSIQLIHQKAVQRLAHFQRRRVRERSLRPAAAGRPDFSYEADDFRPLGLALFRTSVEPSPLPLRDAVGAAPNPRHPAMAEAAAEHMTYALHEDPGHRYAWDMDLTLVTLANFNYKKMSLVRDYNQLVDEVSEHRAFDRVFSIEPRAVEAEVPPPLPLDDQWTVVSADETQNAAVRLARTGRSFIIQGPPGTGKSQTITNLIADYAAQGKRVLFVCEKRAALDVVFHRLKQSGLEELCALIHDSQTDKKDFVANLRDCYQGWIGKPHHHERLNAARGGSVAALRDHLAPIESFEHLMDTVPPQLAASPRTLIRRLMELPAAEQLGGAEREALPDHSTWTRQSELTQRLHRFMSERFGVASLAHHSFRMLATRITDSDSAYSDLQRQIEICEELLASLDAALSDPGHLLQESLSLADALDLASAAERIVALDLCDRPQLLLDTTAESRELEAGIRELHELAEQSHLSAEPTRNWKDKLPADDTATALAYAQAHENSLLRWLEPAWWRLRSEIQRRYDFSRHPIKPAYSIVLAQLSGEHRALTAQTQAEQAFMRKHRVRGDAGRFVAALEQLRADLGAKPVLRGLRATLLKADSGGADAQDLAALATRVAALAQRAKEALHQPERLTFAEIAELLRDLRESLDDLPDAQPLLRAVHQAPATYAEMLRRQALAPPALEALVVTEALARIQRQHPELTRFNAQTLAGCVQKIDAARRRLYAQNASHIQATLHRQFLDQVRLSTLSGVQGQDKQFKKSYSTGRRELEHEFGKSMRFRSIRDLAGDETGLVINDLKPIWLMSPLSVSDTLPLRKDLFDVVIFDEASQIPTEEAVPALCRAQQVVVVGDEMQLPPTSFFSTAGDIEEKLIEVEDEDGRIAINLDADSLLNQAARNLPATLLAWHYRSRHEALISFSNAAFYEGRLITIPDRRIDRASAGHPRVRSDTDAFAAGVDNLLEHPVSFHQLEDGVYIGRSNPPEARYIAGLIRELLKREIDERPSIGVVAFSEAQQGEIESALEALAAEDSDFASRLEREYTREDDDQFNGLFVKNLENVQGDERDLILLSICYAPGPEGRMLMNFGPINQRGGEKRLNVIFSRARKRMAVITTIRSAAITNTHNDGAAALRAFLQFAESSACGDHVRAQTVLASLNPGAQQAFSAPADRDAFRKALGAALRQRGHRVHEQVGRSQFRCDLAIETESGDGYALALLLDGPTGKSVGDVHERYVFRPSVLRAFGWRSLHVLSSDWVRDSERVLERIEAVLRSGEDPMAPLPETELEPLPEDDTVPEGQAGSIPTAPTVVPGTREFRFQEGSSNKFWRIGQQGNDMQVEFGRVGTRGQQQTRAFDSPERAAREVKKLIDEKLRKGYSEHEAASC